MIVPISSPHRASLSDPAPDIASGERVGIRAGWQAAQGDLAAGSSGMKPAGARLVSASSNGATIDESNFDALLNGLQSDDQNQGARAKLDDTHHLEGVTTPAVSVAVPTIASDAEPVSNSARLLSAAIERRGAMVPALGNIMPVAPIVGARRGADASPAQVEALPRENLIREAKAQGQALPVEAGAPPATTGVPGALPADPDQFARENSGARADRATGTAPDDLSSRSPGGFVTRGVSQSGAEAAGIPAERAPANIGSGAGQHVTVSEQPADPRSVGPALAQSQRDNAAARHDPAGRSDTSVMDALASVREPDQDDAHGKAEGKPPKSRHGLHPATASATAAEPNAARLADVSATATTPSAAPAALGPAAPASPSQSAAPVTDMAQFARIAADLAETIEQVSHLREAARSARPEMTLRTSEFGPVTMRLHVAGIDAGGTDLRATLAARDPAFVPAIQAAIAERSVMAMQEPPVSSLSKPGEHGAAQSRSDGSSAGQGQNQGYGNGANGSNSDQRYGTSPGADHIMPQPSSPQKIGQETSETDGQAGNASKDVAALLAGGPGLFA